MGNDTTTTNEKETEEPNNGVLDPEKFMVDGQPYPRGLTLSGLVLGLCLGNFVVALDTTIIATAIPQIVTDFKSLEDVGWYGSIYLLTTTAFQPAFGKIFKFFNMKITYILSILVFEIGSIICAASKDSPTFIVGRAVAGIGAAGLYQGALSIMGLSVPLSRKPIFLAIATSVFGIASCFGPILGGVLTDKAGWEWCFWINLPVGAVAAFIAVLCVTSPSRQDENRPVYEKLKQIDYLGTFILVSSLTCLFLAIQFGGNMYSWSNSRVIGLLIGAGLLAVLFVALQMRLQEMGTVPPRILKQRTVLGGCLYSFFIEAAIYTHSYYIPFYFQSAQNTSATQSGIRSIPYVASLTLFAVIGGTVIVQIGYYLPVLITGTILFIIGSGLITTLKVESGASKWIGYQLLCGIGSGLGVQVPFTALQVVLSAEDMPTGNALTVFTQQLGGSLSIAVAQSIFTNSLRRNLKRHTSLNPQTVIQAGATNLEKLAPPGSATLTALLEAYAKSLDETFILALAAGCLALLCCGLFEWKSIKDGAPVSYNIDEADDSNSTVEMTGLEKQKGSGSTST